MFAAKTYMERRKELVERIPKGLVLLLGNEESPMNYPDNVYPFRQDSTFLYYFGLDEPGLAAVIDAGEGVSTLFGRDPGIEDIVWTGPLPSLAERAARAGAEGTAPLPALRDTLRAALRKGRPVLFLPPYRTDNALKLKDLLDIPPGEARSKASLELIRAVVAQRSVKSREEIEEIEAAHAVTREMHLAAMRTAREGMAEGDLAGVVEGAALARSSRTTFPVILTVHGEILHNTARAGRLEAGRLVICDAGAESPRHYAADITRTFPVSGRFTAWQKEIHDIVLAAQTSAIEASRPGVPYRDVHLIASRTIAAGLKELGIMRGDADEAVAGGAHALFFPHGLGHLMGLDVHDMEDLGEDHVGYDESVRRSGQFGLSYLRLAKPLEPGFVLTVEPGVYFIPELIDLWRSEGKFEEFIDYGALEKWRAFGGLRIEDDLLVTAGGHRVLGEPIPKTAEEIEEFMAAAREG